MAEKKAKKSGPNISKLEWGMVISILGIIDIAQFVLDWIGIPFIATVGTLLNRFISFATGLAWPTYLYLRGVNFDAPKILTVSLGFLLEEIPDVDAMPFWFLDGIVMYASVEAEKKLAKIAKVAVAAGAVALAPETGGASLAAEGAVASGVGAEVGAGAEGASLAGEVAENESVPPELDDEDEEGDDDQENGDSDGGELGDNNEGGSGEENQNNRNSTPKQKTSRRQTSRESRSYSNNNSDQGAEDDASDPNSLDLRGSANNEERQKSKDALKFRSNLLDLSLSYGQRKKAKEDEENSLTE
jgi:hypothetical protein